MELKTLGIKVVDDTFKVSGEISNRSLKDFLCCIICSCAHILVQHYAGNTYPFLNTTSHPALMYYCHSFLCTFLLCQSYAILYVVRCTCLSTVSDQAFQVAAFRLWNSAAERHIGADYSDLRENVWRLFNRSFPKSPVVRAQLLSWFRTL